VTEIGVRIPDQVNWADMESRIERAIVATGLRVSMKTTLKRYAGSIHWHLKTADDKPGTLELTMWPAGGRVWCSVQAGRRAEWIDVATPRLVAAIEAWPLTK
jgi:hypothetical protein